MYIKILNNFACFLKILIKLKENNCNWLHKCLIKINYAKYRSLHSLDLNKLFYTRFSHNKRIFCFVSLISLIAVVVLEIRKCELFFITSYNISLPFNNKKTNLVHSSGRIIK